MGCFFTGRNIRIGKNSIINRRCYLDGRGGLVIGENISISPECYLVSLTHEYDSPDFKAKALPVTIKAFSWIGARAIILPGVSLAEGTVVGAGAVVSRSTEAWDIVAGNPAKRIGKRNSQVNYELNYFPWFSTDILPD